jgi:hypothetical protein
MNRVVNACFARIGARLVPWVLELIGASVAGGSTTANGPRVHSAFNRLNADTVVYRKTGEWTDGPFARRAAAGTLRSGEARTTKDS